MVLVPAVAMPILDLVKAVLVAPVVAVAAQLVEGAVEFVHSTATKKKAHGGEGVGLQLLHCDVYTAWSQCSGSPLQRWYLRLRCQQVWLFGLVLQKS